MKLTVELWQLVGLVVTLAIALSGGFAALLRQLLRQFEKRLESKFSTLEAESKDWHRVERELVQLRLELPERYVRREDYIRNQTIIEGKLDLINERVLRLNHQGASRD